MQPIQLLFLAILFFATTAWAIKDLTDTPSHIQRLSKRGCDFSCRNQRDCDSECYKLDYGVVLLGVCHHDKCFCGFPAP